MIWYLMLSILHTFAFFASLRALCLARRLFPPSTHLAQPIHMAHLDHPAHPAQSTHPDCYLLFVICHLSFVICHLVFLFVICLFVICCIVVFALLGIYFVTFWYCMVLHCMIWYLMLSILHTFAYFASSRGLCLARRLFPPSTHLAQPTHPTHLDHLAQPTHPNQSTLLIWIIQLIQLNPPIRLVICYFSFVICHLVFLFVICLFVICCIVVYCIAWYIFLALDRPNSMGSYLPHIPR